ncbi:MAG: hypothetical protein U1E40_13955 [Amaricoccus sp.]
MAERGRGRGILWLAFALALAACGRHGGTTDGQGIALRFEDKAEPGVFSGEGPAVRDGPKGAGGLWAAVAGLPRPERGLVVNAGTGAKVVVALFAAGKGGPAIRLSNEAADALGIGDDPVPVRITALRREPELDTTRGRF